MIVFDALGQVSGYVFKRNDLKSFKRIVITSNSNSNDKLISKSIYYIDSNGDITKSESYDSGELTSWTKYEYQIDGKIKYEENHHQVFSYDEKQKKHIGKVREDVYNGRRFTYNDDTLLEITYVDGYGGSETYSNLSLFEYDNNSQLVNEIFINFFVGLTGTFQSNSTVLDSMYYKGEATKHRKTNQYLKDSIVTTIYDESNKIYGYQLTKLNFDKKPNLIIDTDAFGNKIKYVSMIYDKRGNLMERRTHIIDINKIDYDLASGDCYQIVYNKKGLPITHLTMENNKIISKSTLTYD